VNCQVERIYHLTVPVRRPSTLSQAGRVDPGEFQASLLPVLGEVVTDEAVLREHLAPVTPAMGGIEDPVVWAIPHRHDVAQQAITATRSSACAVLGRLEDEKSLVLSEDDYFEWLRRWTNNDPEVPSYVLRALKDFPLLLLGYRVDDWDFRFVFQSVKSSGASSADNHHVAVQLSPASETIDPEAAQSYLERFLGSDKIEVY
jgi:hypothetical protein